MLPTTTSTAILEATSSSAPVRVVITWRRRSRLLCRAYTIYTIHDLFCSQILPLCPTTDPPSTIPALEKPGLSNHIEHNASTYVL